MAAGDRLDARPWVERFFTTDAEFIQPGRPPVQGHAAIIAAMDAQQAVLQSITHNIKHVDLLPERVYVEADIKWAVKGDPEQKVVIGRGLGVFNKKLDEDRISRFDVFADFSELTKRYQYVQQRDTIH